MSPYPLLIQLHQLLSDLRRVERQAQAVDIKLWHQILQHLFEGQTSSETMLGCGGYSIFQDGAPQGIQLEAAQPEGEENENRKSKGQNKNLSLDKKNTPTTQQFPMKTAE